MGKNKNWCTICLLKHYPPTGKKCQNKSKSDSEHSDVVNSGMSSDEQVNQDLLLKKKSKASKGAVKRTRTTATGKKDLLVKKAFASGQLDLSGSGDDLVAAPDAQQSSDLQLLILKQLQKVNDRLDHVEEQVTASRDHQPTKKDKHKLSTSARVVKKDKTFVKNKVISESSESSEDDMQLPSLSTLRSSRCVQRQVDHTMADLESKQCSEGNNNVSKIKSKRGGPVEVVVQKKVAWPHEPILGGPSRQRITYDQLSLTQLVQGFVKNIFEEGDQKCRDRMLAYLGDIMEDATDFGWANAKASHAVMLCEMERGSLSWFDSERIDRLRRAHAQRHSAPNKQNWGKGSDSSRRPWFCRQFQLGLCNHQKDHEVGGRVHKHLCSQCLSQGRFLSHPEKDCHFVKKSQSTRNQVGAVQL